MNEDDVRILTARLAPLPRQLSFQDGEEYRLSPGCRFVLRTPAVDAVARLARDYWAITPEIICADHAEGMAAEAYSLRVTADEIVIAASDLRGVRHAMRTLRQLAEVERGHETFSCHLLPQVEITDAPAMPFRGVHLCWFPETFGWQIEKQLRLAAYYKFNHVVLEMWGTFPFLSHPELCWREHQVDRAELKRLIRLGQELGVTLVPQFNMLGHGSGSSIGNGKHVLLDFNPALQPLLEPDGWSWCLSNPATIKTLAEVMDELHEFFGRPPYFHIGGDEAFNIRTCSACRKMPLCELVKKHLLHLHERLAKRGCQMIMWHDMLLNHHDPRWLNYVVHDRAPINLEPLLAELPKDIVIADWQYKYPESDGVEPTWDSARFFKERGFEVLVSPWLSEKGTLSMGRMAARERLTGMLVTTWNGNSGVNYFKIFSLAAQASWNGDYHDLGNADAWQMCNFHVRQVGWDMKLDEYVKSGTAKTMRLD